MSASTAATPATAESPAQRLAALCKLDERTAYEGRFVTTSFLVEVGNEPFLVAVDRGRVTGVTAGPLVMPSWSFALRASRREWDRFWEPSPPPGSNDLFAMLRRKELRIEGDLHPFMSNLLYFKALLTVPRKEGAI